MPLRIATFNSENIFARYRFRQNFTPSDNGWTINDMAFRIFNDEEKNFTAKAIKETDADIICLQEVEGMKILEGFNSRRLARLGYKHKILIDSHDPRHIDICILSRYPFTNIRTYKDDRSKRINYWLFSRDCLTVDLNINGKPLRIYNNHFKSMLGGRDKTRDRRLEQVERVKEIVDLDWKGQNYNGNFIVLGDFNDYRGQGTALDPLLNHPELFDVNTRLPANERWTHYWVGGNQYKQLDYILISRKLADSNNNKPELIRKGLPWRAEKYTGERYENIGWDNPKSSDHCPLVMELDTL